MFKFLLNVLFPPRCLGCQTYLTYKSSWSYRSIRPVSCDNCFKTIPINSGFYCPLCSRRLPEPKKICHSETKYILAAVSSYQNPVLKELIHSLKYQNIKSAIEPIELLIKLYLEKIIGKLSAEDGEIKNYILVPVPLYPKKERQRGFNQAQLIAEVIQRLICPIRPVGPIYPIINNTLIRIKNTSSQTKLESCEERIKNVAGAFQVKYPEKIKGRNIILVDDVSTSGATLNEAARLLKEAGAKHILAFVIAKA